MEAESHYTRIRIWRVLNRRIANRKLRADSSEHQIASGRSRQAKVFVALALSMTAGVILLKALGNNPPSAGAFCLSQYWKLASVEEAISCRATQSTQLAVDWNRIRVYYSGTKSGNLSQLALSAGLAAPEDIDCHFVICNGLGGGDGQIQRTEKWERQWPVNRDSGIVDSESGRTTIHESLTPIHEGGQTIRICVIADPPGRAHPTDLQIRRTEALVEELCRRFNIQSQDIHYPSDWR